MVASAMVNQKLAAKSSIKKAWYNNFGLLIYYA